MSIKAGDNDPLNIKSSEIANAIPGDEPDSCKACAAMGAVKWTDMDHQPIPRTVQELANYTSVTLACSVSYLVGLGIIEFTSKGRCQGHMLKGEDQIGELMEKLVKSGPRRQVPPDGSVEETGCVAVTMGPDGKVQVEGDLSSAPDWVREAVERVAQNKQKQSDPLQKLLDDLSEATGRKKKYELN